MLYHNVLLPHKKNITEPWKTKQQPQTSHTNPITHLFVVLVLSSLSLVTIYSILTRTHQSSGWAESVWCPSGWSRSCWGPTASRSWTTPPWRAQARRGWCRQPGQKKMWWKIIFIRGKNYALTSTSSPSLVWINICSGSTSGLWSTSSWTW